MMHAHHPTPAPDDKVHPNPSFRAWVRKHPYVWITEMVAALALFASFGYYASTLVASGSSKVTADQWLVVNHIIHVVLLLAAGIFLTYHLNDNHEGRTRTNWLWDELFQRPEQHRKTTLKDQWPDREERAELSVRAFKRYFLLFLIFLFLDYGWQLLGDHDAGKKRTPQEYVIPVSVTDIESSSGGELSLSVNIGDKVEVPKEDDGASDMILKAATLQHPIVTSVLKELYSELIEFLFNTLGAFALLLCFLQLRDPGGWTDWGRGLKILLVAVLGAALLLIALPFIRATSTTTCGELANYVTMLNWVSGAFNAWVMIVLFSRLDSKLIGLPSSLVAILYAYAAVQTFFAVFEWTGMLPVKVFTYYAVLVLKLYFFFIVHYALVQGRIYCYMFCAPELKELRKDGTTRGVLRVAFFLLGLLAVTVYCCYRAWFVKDGMQWAEDLVGPVSWWHVGVLGLFLIKFLTLKLGEGDKEVKQATDRWSKVHTVSDVEWTERPKKGDDKHECYRTDLGSGLNHVRKWFTFFISSLLVYYLLSALWPLADEALRQLEPDEGSGMSTGSKFLMDMVLIAVNSAGGLFIFLAFTGLARPHTSAHYAEKRTRHGRLGWLFFFFLLLLMVVSGFNMWMGYLGKDTEVVRSGVMLWAMVSGLLVSMCFSLFIARFDGTLMWQSTLEVRALMIYAALQPMLVVFVAEEPVFQALKAITLVQALVLKVWLFWLVYRTLTNGDMATYHYLFPVFDNMANKIFRHGFLIRNGSHNSGRYSLDIYSEGNLVLSSHMEFDDQRWFMRAAKELCRKEIAVKNFTTPDVNGAYTVVLHFDVNDPKEAGAKLHLHFVGHQDFVRKEDADEFIRRARTSLPFARTTFA